MLFKTVNEGQKLLPEKVAEQIIRLIANNNLVAGQKLPNEFQLADELQVGRNTVREAVKLLVSRNILEIEHGRGTFVCENPGLVDDPLGLAFFQDKYKLAQDLMQIRWILEPQIAAIAADNAKEEDITDMKRLSKAIMEKAAAEEDYIPLDRELHIRIAQSTQNQVIPNLIPIIDSGIQLFNILPYKVERLKALEVHNEIIEAIEHHDPGAAEQAMRKHLEFNVRNFNKLNEQQYGKFSAIKR